MVKLDVSMGRGTHGLPRGSFLRVAENFLFFGGAHHETHTHKKAKIHLSKITRPNPIRANGKKIFPYFLICSPAILFLNKQ